MINGGRTRNEGEWERELIQWEILLSYINPNFKIDITIFLNKLKKIN